MAERVARAGRLADAALASAPDAPAAARVKIDALRLAGQPDAARTLVAKVIGQASQPETAYVLAALDLAEPEPFWSTVLERLRLAASGEGAAGRARAALVYSLAKSGDSTGARAELVKLDALARPYPLSPDLHALLDRGTGKGSPDAGAEAAGGGRSPAAPMATGGNPAPSPPPAPAAGGEAPAGDPRSAMQQASQAFKKGDLPRARQIYEAIVTRNPTDSEAVAALGDVARAQGDSSGAMANYKRAIAVNPSYLPALLGLADTQWVSGDKTAAVRGYGDIVDRFPEGTYPAYVKQRIEGAAAAPATSPAAAGAGKSAVPGASDESSP
jgi:tetratricopeptide (TPR) repeat protein